MGSKGDHIQINDEQAHYLFGKTRDSIKGLCQGVNSIIMQGGASHGSIPHNTTGPDLTAPCYLPREQCDWLHVARADMSTESSRLNSGIPIEKS